MSPSPDGPRTLELLSVVAPVFNEEALVEEFYARTCAALDATPYELVLVDDGSTDGTPLPLERLRLLPLALDVHQADAEDAPALVAGQRQDPVDVDRLMGAVEVAHGQVGDAGRDRGTVVGGARDRGRQGRQGGGIDHGGLARRRRAGRGGATDQACSSPRPRCVMRAG